MSKARQARCFSLVLIIVLALMGAGKPATAAPADQVRQYVERALAVVHDPAFQGEAKARERRAAIRQVASGLFDFEEMARRSLGRHWRGRTAAERAEFTELFAELLERAYIVRIEEYRGELIRYRLGAIEEDRATVHTTIHTTTGAAVPVDYRMLREGTRWLVYDVVIEGVSLVANYRTQFNRIIRTSSWEELIQRMKAKTANAAA